jgi:hypothetical protein
VWQEWLMARKFGATWNAARRFCAVLAGSRLCPLMGDLPKPSDDATWTDLEQSFFAAAPPDEPETLGESARVEDVPARPPQRTRRENLLWLRPRAAAAGRRATLVLTAAGGLAQRVGRRTILSLGRLDRRNVVVVVATVVVGFTAGRVVFRKGAPAKAPSPAIAAAAPVAASGSRARADVSDRRPHAHRKPAASSAQRPVVTAYRDRESYWARGSRSAPGRSGRPFFSR